MQSSQGNSSQPSNLADKPSPEVVDQQSNLIKEAKNVPPNLRAAILEICTKRIIDQGRLQFLLRDLESEITIGLATTDLVLWLEQARDHRNISSGNPLICYTWGDLAIACTATQFSKRKLKIDPGTTTPDSSTMMDLLGNSVSVEKKSNEIFTLKIRSRQEIGMAIQKADIPVSGIMDSSSFPIFVQGEAIPRPLMFNGTTNRHLEDSFLHEVVNKLQRIYSIWDNRDGLQCFQDALSTTQYASPLMVNRIILFGLKHVYHVPLDRKDPRSFGCLATGEICKLLLMRDLLYYLRHQYKHPERSSPLSLVICWPIRNLSPALEILCENILRGHTYCFANEDEAWTTCETNNRLGDTIVVSLTPHFPVRQMITDLGRDGVVQRYPAAIVCNSIGELSNHCQDAICVCAKEHNLTNPASPYPFCYCYDPACRDPVSREVIELGQYYHSIGVTGQHPEMVSIFGYISAYTSKPSGPTACNLQPVEIMS